jgi:hypothetical protein
MEFSEFRIPPASPDMGGGERGVQARRYRAGAAGGPLLVLAHGAGAPQSHPFMVQAASALAARGIHVVTFNFPYMDAGRKVPDRTPALERTWLDVIRHVAAGGDLPERVFIGGKSMGGRIASHVAASEAAEARSIAGLVCLGYPLHPPGQPERRRDAHLPRLRVPSLIVQGSRDAFGTPEELAPVLRPLGPRVTLHVVGGGDHSFAVPRATGRRRHDVLGEVWDVVADWVVRVAGGRS